MRSFVAPLKLTSMIQAGILSATQEPNTEQIHSKFNFEIRENTGHGRTVLWFGQDFLIGRPVQRHACKMYVLPIFEGLPCVQR